MVTKKYAPSLAFKGKFWTMLSLMMSFLVCEITDGKQEGSIVSD